MVDSDNPPKVDAAWEANHERTLVSKIAVQLNEAILKDTDLCDFADKVTGLGLHQMWLGMAEKNAKITEIGRHLYELGGELSALAIIRMDRARKEG